MGHLKRSYQNCECLTTASLSSTQATRTENKTASNGDWKLGLLGKCPEELDQALIAVELPEFQTLSPNCVVSQGRALHQYPSKPTVIDPPLSIGPGEKRDQQPGVQPTLDR
jgi:hypothetical protein